MRTGFTVYARKTTGSSWRRGKDWRPSNNNIVNWGVWPCNYHDYREKEMGTSKLTCYNDQIVNNALLSGGGGHSNVEGYQARPKIHVIRVVFQDQALYARISFRVAKTCKIGKKGCVFGHIDKFWKENGRQIKKNACKNAYLGSFFIPEKYVIRVLFKSPWTILIPPLAIRVPPGLALKW